MTFKQDNPQDDEVYKLLAEMKENIILARFAYMEARRNKDVNLEEKMEEIINLEEDFNGLLQIQTGFLKLQKIAGHGNTKYSEDFLIKMESIKANVGRIVSHIPKVTTNGLQDKV